MSKLELQVAAFGLIFACLIWKSSLSRVAVSFWNESSNVLQWVPAVHKQFMVFVANKVTEIFVRCRVDKWKFVSGFRILPITAIVVWLSTNYMVLNGTDFPLSYLSIFLNLNQSSLLPSWRLEKKRVILSSTCTKFAYIPTRLQA